MATRFKNRVMEDFMGLIRLAIILLICTSSTGDPGGFLSIDCGSTKPYHTDPRTNLTWRQDEPYILVGNNGAIPESLQNTLNSSYENREAVKSFRYFPVKRNKYCYELPAKSNTTFVIRAMFLHGYSPLLPQSLRFQVYIQGTHWIQVQYGLHDSHDFKFMQPEVREAVYFNEKAYFDKEEDLINICLVPEINMAFISSLELREMDFNSYSEALTDGLWRRSFLLSSLRRMNAGPDYTPVVRYPDDVYDRLWTSPQDTNFHSFYGDVVSTRDISTSILRGLNELPAGVTKDALEWPANLYPNSIELYWEYLFDPVPQSLACFIFYFHNNQSGLRSDKTIIVQPKDLSTTVGTFELTSQTSMKYMFHEVVQNYSDYEVTISRSPATTQLLALEVYLQQEITNEGVYIYGGDLIAFIKEAFNMSDWQGLACFPKPHDWLTCAKHGDDIMALESITLSHIHNVDELMKYPTSGRSSWVFMSTWSMTYSNMGDEHLMSLFNGRVWFGSIQYLNVSNNNITADTFNPERWMEWGNVTILDTPYRLVKSFDVSHNHLGTAFLRVDLKPFFFDDVYGTDLQVLDLSYNKIAGEIPNDFFSILFNANSTGFQSLYVDHNAITGKLNFTTWYDKIQTTFRNSSSINDSLNIFHQLFSFVNNSISVIIPSVEELESNVNVILLIQRFNNTGGGLLLGGNPFCKGAKSLLHRYLCRSSTSDMSYAYNKKKHSKLPIIFGVLGGALLLFVGLALSAIIWRLRKQLIILQEVQQELLNRKVQPPFFAYHDLKIATKEFAKKNKLGEGSFGAVYKGILQDKREVAVKKLFSSENEVQVLNDFLNEVVLLTGIKHRNLVQLLGCCVNNKERILVYELAERGNVADALWGKPAELHMLTWEERLNICVGVAWGLSYLHKELEPGIIHRDIKAANVLIDKNLNPKIADFGLAKLFREEETQANFTFVAGTRGYIAPEHALDANLTDKADVYSFGVLTLEIVSGRRCLDEPEEHMKLKEWAEKLQGQGRLLDLLPPGLEAEKCPEDEVAKVINIALLCVAREPLLRPSMTQVAVMLTGTADDTMFISFKEKRRRPERLAFDFGGEADDQFERISLMPPARENSTGSHCQMDDTEEAALIHSRDLKSSCASSLLNGHSGELQDSARPSFQEKVASFSRSLSRKLGLPVDE